MTVDKTALELAKFLIEKGALTATTGVIGSTAASTIGGTAIASGATAVGSGIVSTAGFIAAHTMAGSLTGVLTAVAACNPLGLGILAIGGGLTLIGKELFD